MEDWARLVAYKSTTDVCLSVNHQFAREVIVDDQLKQFLCEMYTELQASARQLWPDGIVLPYTTHCNAVHARVCERALPITGSCGTKCYCISDCHYHLYHQHYNKLNKLINSSRSVYVAVARYDDKFATDFYTSG